MSLLSAVTTHVLDTARGVPAAGVAVRLERVGAGSGTGGGTGTGTGTGTGSGTGEIARGRTDADGRVRDLGPARLPAGTYRLVFDTGAYLVGQGDQAAFFPEVAITFALPDDAAHCHVPLLLSPFAYSTYRGS
jgi:5-hydroxyisourate hydrolase